MKNVLQQQSVSYRYSNCCHEESGDDTCLVVPPHCHPETKDLPLLQEAWLQAPQPALQEQRACALSL